MVLRRAIHEGGARQRRTTGIERVGRALAGDGVHLAGEMHVERLGKHRARVIRVFRTRQKRAELRVNLGDPPRRAVRFRLDVAEKLLKTRDNLLDSASAQQTEKLNLMVSAEFRHPHERRLVPLVHAHQLGQPRTERREVRPREGRKAVELGPGEEMHALHGMVVVQRRGDPLAALRDRRADARLGPGERLHAPLLPPFAEMLERLVIALRHHHVVKREPQSADQPIVQDDQLRARHVAL